jgi:hypothetical protein
MHGGIGDRLFVKIGEFGGLATKRVFGEIVCRGFD